MGMFDKRLEVGIATAAAILTTATASFSQQTSPLTLPKASPEPALSWKGIIATPEQREAQQADTMKYLSEPEKTPQEQKTAITQRLVTQLAGIGRSNMNLEPGPSGETLGQYEERATQRVKDMFALHARCPDEIQRKDETFDQFALRVERQYRVTELKRDAKAAIEVRELNGLPPLPPQSPQEQKSAVTKKIESQISHLGRGLQLEPKQDESIEEYQVRAEDRARDLLKLNALNHSAVQNKDETFAEFTARVVNGYFESKK